MLPLNNATARSAFNFLLLNLPCGNEIMVNKTIQATATFPGDNCMSSNPTRCCEIMELRSQDQFTINSPDLAIGFGPQQNGDIKLQGLYPQMLPTFSDS